jgi:hypothetical protein
VSFWPKFRPTGNFIFLLISAYAAVNIHKTNRSTTFPWLMGCYSWALTVYGADTIAIDLSLSALIS